MKRYLLVLKLFWTTAMAAELEYRLNFVIAAISSIVNLIGSIFSLFLFYRTGYNFEGWDWLEAIIVLGMFTLLQGFSATFLIPNLNKIVEQVELGTLDFVLLKPISSQFWVSTRIISPWGFPDLIFGILIIAYAGINLNLKSTNYLLGILPIIFGLVILYSIWFMLGTMSIWFVKVFNITEVLRGLLEAGRYPKVAYPAAYRFFFTFIVPVTFLTTIPAETILGRSNFYWIIGAGFLAVLLFLIAHFFWKFALRFYTSASS